MKKVTLENIIEFRRYFHKNPELSLKEYNTKKYIKSILDKNKISYEEVLDTGLIVIFRGENNNPKDRTILFRADIDALPIKEENDIEFKSINEGVMHACGHDGHTTILLATLLEVSEYYKKNSIDINIIFVFQPAEETKGGAEKIINSSFVFDEYNIEACYALHLNPDYEENSIISKSGYIMASANQFIIKIKGKASHVGLKHNGIDSINAACIIYQEMLKINSLQLDPYDVNIIHIGKLVAGDASNIVANSASLEGTIRTLKNENYKKIMNKINNIIKSVENLTDTKIDIEITTDYASVKNDEVLYELIKNITQKENIKYIELPKSYLYGEDFSSFSKVSPINYSFLGIRNEKKGYTSGLHTPTFNFDEECLITGIKYFLAIFKYYSNI